MKRYTAYVLIALAMTLSLSRMQSVGEEVAVDAKASKQARALVVAAENMYQATQAAYDAGTVTMDLLFAWSRRWLQAELDAATNDEQRIAAYRAHSSRMKRIYHKTAALHKAQVKGGEFDKFWAVVYHVGEAEAMLRKADTTAKDKITVKMKPGGDIDFDGRETCQLSEPVSFSDALARHAELLKLLAYDPAESIVDVQAEKGVTAGDVKKLTFLCKEAGFPHVTYQTPPEKVAR